MPTAGLTLLTKVCSTLVEHTNVALTRKLAEQGTATLNMQHTRVGMDPALQT